MNYTGFKFIGKDDIRNNDKHCTRVKYLDTVVTIDDAIKNILK